MHNCIRFVILVVALSTSGCERAAESSPPKPAVVPSSQPVQGFGSDRRTSVASVRLSGFKAAW